MRRLMPVILLIDRILDPSAKAAITVICLSLGSALAIGVEYPNWNNVIQFLFAVNCFCVTLTYFDTRR